MTLWTPSNGSADFTASGATAHAGYRADQSSEITQSSGLVSQWDDWLGGGHHVGATGSGRPTYSATAFPGSLPGITCSQPSQTGLSMVSGLGIASSTLVSVFVVGLLKASPGGIYNRLVSLARLGDIDDFSDGGSYIPLLRHNNFDSLEAYAGGDTSSAGITQNVGFVAAQIQAATTLQPFVNGTGGSTFTKTPNYAWDELGIGQRATGANTDCWDGVISEVLIVTGTVTTTLRQLIEGYLAWKWGLQASLPSGHPYLSAAPTISGSATNLTPSLFVNTNTFHAATVSPGSITLAPSLLSNVQAFYGPAVTSGASTLAPPFYTDLDNFFAPTVGRGAVTLSPSLFSDADAFYTATVGGASLQPALFVETDVFYGPSIGRGEVSLSPSLFSDVDAFFAPVVGRASATLQPSLLSNGNVFFGPTVSAVRSLLPSLFANSNIFYSPTVSRLGLSELLPSFFENQNTFFAAVILQTAGFVTNPLERLKMYTGSMGSVSNREDWIVNISLVGDDGTSFDISDAEIVAYICNRGCHDRAILSASLDDGIVLTDNYTMQWAFTEEEMARLCPQQYDVYCRITRDEITTQLLAANVTVVEGGPA